MEITFIVSIQSEILNLVWIGHFKKKNFLIININCSHRNQEWNTIEIRMDWLKLFSQCPFARLSICMSILSYAKLLYTKTPQRVKIIFIFFFGSCLLGFDIFNLSHEDLRSRIKLKSLRLCLSLDPNIESLHSLYILKVWTINSSYFCLAYYLLT